MKIILLVENNLMYDAIVFKLIYESDAEVLEYDYFVALEELEKYSDNVYDFLQDLRCLMMPGFIGDNNSEIVPNILKFFDTYQQYVLGNHLSLYKVTNSSFVFTVDGEICNIEPIESYSSPPAQFYNTFPALMTYKCVCPGQCTNFVAQWLKDVIICLNDKHNWSRERIADWLDSLEIDLTAQ